MASSKMTVEKPNDGGIMIGMTDELVVPSSANTMTKIVFAMVRAIWTIGTEQVG